MKLIIAIVQDDDASFLMEKLIAAGFSSTKLATTGGFLKAGNTTFLTGVEDERLDEVIGIISANCKSRRQMMPVYSYLDGAGVTSLPQMMDVSIGGATVFVLPVEHFLKL